MCELLECNIAHVRVWLNVCNLRASEIENSLLIERFLMLHHLKS